MIHRIFLALVVAVVLLVAGQGIAVAEGNMTAKEIHDLEKKLKLVMLLLKPILALCIL